MKDFYRRNLVVMSFIEAFVFTFLVIKIAPWFFGAAYKPSVFLNVIIYCFSFTALATVQLKDNKAEKERSGVKAPEVAAATVGATPSSGTATSSSDKNSGTTQNVNKPTPPVNNQNKSNNPFSHLYEGAEEEDAQAQQFPSLKPKIANSNFTFDSIAGYETTKNSLKFLVDCLTNQDKLKEVGAKVPTGVLLFGPPGTGKTLFAKAIAGAAGVPMFEADASQFVDVFVGQGSRNIRTLYQKARENAPCIVFIDELDAVGGQRTGTMNDERRQTLNALLVELNGMKSSSNIITIAATNDYKSLDAALVRQGRFDRKIAVPLPNLDDRKSILKLYLESKALADDVSLEELALMTENMSGSAIETLINESAIHAVSEGRTVICKADTDAALFQMLTDGEQKEITNTDELKVIAYHEAGHALAIKLLSKEKVPSVTIIGSTSGFGGVTFRHSSEEHFFESKRSMENKIKTIYAGRVAEEYYFQNDYDITNGASRDLSDASSLIRDYFINYGMGSQSPLNVDVFTGRQCISQVEEAKQLASKLYEETKTFILENQKTLERIASALLQKKTLNDQEIDKLIGQEAV